MTKRLTLALLYKYLVLIVWVHSCVHVYEWCSQRPEAQDLLALELQVDYELTNVGAEMCLLAKQYQLITTEPFLSPYNFYFLTLNIIIKIGYYLCIQKDNTSFTLVLPYQQNTSPSINIISLFNFLTLPGKALTLFHESPLSLQVLHQSV